MNGVIEDKGYRLVTVGGTVSGRRDPIGGDIVTFCMPSVIHDCIHIRIYVHNIIL